MKKYWIVITAIVLLLIGFGIEFSQAGIMSAGQFAKDYFAAGNFSAGIFSAGIFSVGVFSIGIFNIGLFSIGLFVMAWKKKLPFCTGKPAEVKEE